MSRWLGPTDLLRTRELVLLGVAVLLGIVGAIPK